MFAVCFAEHLFIDAAVIDEGRGHVPVRSYHSKMSASVVSASQHLHDVGRALRIELGEKPSSRAAHAFLAAQLIKLQNQLNVMMLVTHSCLLCSSDFYRVCLRNGPRIGRIRRMVTDLIRANLSNPSDPWLIVSFFF